MSFSAAFSGSRPEILRQMLAFSEDLVKRDQSWPNTVAGVIEGHQAQMRIAYKAVKHAQGVDEQELIVNISGHANSDGSGQIHVTVTCPPGLTCSPDWVKDERHKLAVGESTPTNSEGPESL